MNDIDLMGMLGTLREHPNKTAKAIIEHTATDVNIAIATPGGAVTASFSLAEETRMARNAMCTVIMQMLLIPSNSQG